MQNAEFCGDRLTPVEIVNSAFTAPGAHAMCVVGDRPVGRFSYLHIHVNKFDPGSSKIFGLLMRQTVWCLSVNDVRITNGDVVVSAEVSVTDYVRFCFNVFHVTCVFLAIIHTDRL